MQSSRPPRGGRGLKLFLAIVCMTVRESPPSRGAWIEIIRYLSIAIILLSRPPRGGRGLKSLINRITIAKQSRPPRGGRGLKLYGFGGRNWSFCRPPRGGRGLKSETDGAGIPRRCGRPPRGGRGLKFLLWRWIGLTSVSPPSRGAWIEIQASLAATCRTGRVAPLAGGVD